ncbi:MAG: sugar phosphate isomerase/epimerase [Clostridia bacterium]|nr:sugar phosphate isomerase/epimerase [Clostridia bacterium]
MLTGNISGFSDEISKNVTEQFEHLNKLGIEYFEPRGIDGTNISDLTIEQAHQLKATMDKYGIKASSIGSPIGKIGINDEFEPHLEKLAHTIEIAKILGTKYIRIFSFFIPQGEDAASYRDEVIARMKAMTALAEREGVILLHENEKDIYGDIASRCHDVVTSVNSPNLRCVFDPANFVQCGQVTYPDAYELLGDYVEYMHIKDALSDGSVVPAGQGEGHVADIVKQLSAKNYGGFFSMEPHLGSFEGLAALETGDEMLKLDKSDAGKFTLAYTEFKKIFDQYK